MSAESSAPTADATVALKPPDVWLTGRQTAKQLSINVKSLPRLVERRLLTRRQVPGMPAKYSSASVERLLAKSTINAADEDGGDGE
jgi:hypothetical protein